MPKNSAGVPIANAATAPNTLLQQDSAPQTTGSRNAPRDCIDPLMAGHIAATFFSLLPLPGWAGAAAYALNIALKRCSPELTAPPDIVVEQSNQGCVHLPRNRWLTHGNG